MRNFCIVLIAVGALAGVGRAQDVTNAPKTEIENFEAQPGVVIIKGFGQTGSLTTGAGVISVQCKESVNAVNGRKQYGAALTLAGDHQEKEWAVVDYNEIAPLLNGIGYLGRITYDATALPGFEAVYSTKSGLRIVAYSSRRQGAIQTFVQFYNCPRILLGSDQMTQLQGLIGQAKASLDSLKNAK